ncbi:MAG: permease, partial [Marivirga sp.]|nr:permease [Marivirga sp.]
MNHKKHYIAGISAFVIWGFFSIPLRALSEYSVGEILYFRIFLSSLVLLGIIFGFKRGELRKDFYYLK